MASETLRPIILLYLLAVMLVVYKRPNIMFKNRKWKLRQFGLGRTKTLFSFHTILVFLAVSVAASTYASTPA